jgi:hypothetical protein
MAAFVAVAALAPGTAVGGSSALSRSTLLTLSPAPGDLVLAVLRFPGSGRHTLGPHTLRLAFAGLRGEDYLAVAAVARPPHGGARALVLLVNRPTAVLDPAHVRLRARWSAALGGLSARNATDVLARSGSPRSTALCGLTRSGRALGASALRALSHGGSPLGSFSPGTALAAAYDATCGLAYPLAFKQAVQGSSGGCGTTATRSGALCCPPNAMCVPGPEPVPQPAPEPSPGPPNPEPRCPPCNPRPGTACPLVAQPALCPEVAPARARTLAPGGSR